MLSTLIRRWRRPAKDTAAGRVGAGRSLRPLRSMAALLALLVVASSTQAQDVRFFRIGTGSTAGTYYPVGGMIANAISKPPGSRECDRGGSCGVPGLIAVAQSTEGSVANIEAIAEGTLESGLSQADVAFWAYNGNGIFAARGAKSGLRAVANLFPESVHLVVSRDSGIREPADLRGKRISVDQEGSGTRVDAILILEAYGIGPSDFQLESLPAGTAADKLRAGELDGFFFVAGAPATAVTQLAQDNLVTLVPIDGTEIDDLLWLYPFFAKGSIASGTYFNVPQTATLSVGAQLIVSAELPEQLVYDITRALWHENTRRLLDSGHPEGAQIVLETALKGLAIPLHPGAERWYHEQALLGGPADGVADGVGDGVVDGVNGALPPEPQPAREN